MAGISAAAASVRVPVDVVVSQGFPHAGSADSARVAIDPAGSG